MRTASNTREPKASIDVGGRRVILEMGVFTTSDVLSQGGGVVVNKVWDRGKESPQFPKA